MEEETEITLFGTGPRKSYSNLIAITDWKWEEELALMDLGRDEFRSKINPNNSQWDHQLRHLARLFCMGRLENHGITPEELAENPALRTFECWSANKGELVKITRTNATGQSRQQGIGVTFQAEKSKLYLGHRLSWATINGYLYNEMPNGDISHLCHNSMCWRPSHLNLESHQINMLRNRCVGYIFFRDTNCLVKVCHCGAQPPCILLQIHATMDVVDLTRPLRRGDL